jgi:DNA-binding transcriptional ArsR family regulator
VDVFGAVADPVRRRIVELLSRQGLAAGRVAASFTEISRPAVSRHLRVLREAGVVEADLVGRERVYRTRPEALEEVERWAASLRPSWERHFDALETEVHRSRRERERRAASEGRAAPCEPSTEEQTA